VICANGRDYNKFLEPGFWAWILGGLSTKKDATTDAGGSKDDPFPPMDGEDGPLYTVLLKVLERLNAAWLRVMDPKTSFKDWLVGLSP